MTDREDKGVAVGGAKNEHHSTSDDENLQEGVTFSSVRTIAYLMPTINSTQAIKLSY